MSYLNYIKDGCRCVIVQRSDDSQKCYQVGYIFDGGNLFTGFNCDNESSDFNSSELFEIAQKMLDIQIEEAEKHLDSLRALKK